MSFNYEIPTIRTEVSENPLGLANCIRVLRAASKGVGVDLSLLEAKEIVDNNKLAKLPVRDFCRFLTGFIRHHSIGEEDTTD